MAALRARHALDRSTFMAALLLIVRIGFEMATTQTETSSVVRLVRCGGRRSEGHRTVGHLGLEGAEASPLVLASG